MNQNHAQTSATDNTKIRDDANERLYNALNHIRDTKNLVNPCEDAGIEKELSDKVWRAADSAQVQIEAAMTMLSQIKREEKSE